MEAKLGQDVKKRVDCSLSTEGNEGRPYFMSGWVQPNCKQQFY